MKLPWGIHTINQVVGSPDCAAGLPDGRYVRAIPEPYRGNYLVAAWWVLRGRAVAFIWPRAGELEEALGFSKPQRTWPSEAERTARAAAASAHLPKPDAFKVTSFSNEDIEALGAAFRKRFNEGLPRTETLMAVASIGYRMALRDMAQK